MKLSFISAFLLLFISAHAQRQLTMKCIWAEYVGTDTVYIIKDKLGEIEDISIEKHGNTFYSTINQKLLEGESENYLSSRRREIDYWAYYANCSFTQDFSKMEWSMHDGRMKKMGGKSYTINLYYVRDLSIEACQTKQEFIELWDK